jgi:hypothetical protein
VRLRSPDAHLVPLAVADAHAHADPDAELAELSQAAGPYNV